MTRALEEYEVLGIRTTIPFFLWLMREPDFIAARFDTTYLDRAAGGAGAASRSAPFTDVDERRIAIAAALDAMWRGGEAGRLPGGARAALDSVGASGSAAWLTPGGPGRDGAPNE